MAVPSVLPSVATAMPAAAAIGFAGLAPAAMMGRAEDCIAAGAFKAALAYLAMAKNYAEARSPSATSSFIPFSPSPSSSPSAAAPLSSSVKVPTVLSSAAAATTTPPSVDYLRALCFLRLKDTLSARAALVAEVGNFPTNADAVDLLGRVNTSLRHSFALPQEVVASEPVFAAFYEKMNAHAAATNTSGSLALAWPRLFSLYCHAKELCEAGVEGDFVECGTDHSADVPSALLLATVAKAFGGPSSSSSSPSSTSTSTSPSSPQRRVILCSAFTGTAADNCQTNADLRALTAAFGAADIIKISGALEDVLPRLVSSASSSSASTSSATSAAENGDDGDVRGIRVRDVALLHIDCEWYGSAKAAMASLFPRVVGGGVVQIDDYAYWDGCRQAVAEELNKCGLSPRSALNAVDTNAVWLRKE